MTQEWYNKNKYSDIRNSKITAKVNEKYLWSRFKNHHYMSHTLPPGSKFWTFYIDVDGEETLIACLGVILQVHKLPAKRITRFVVLPEYQGLGFSTKILNAVGEYYRRLYYIMYIVTFHPRLEAGLHNGPWSPSLNNDKTFKVNSKSVADYTASNHLRAGQRMFRFKYLPDNDFQYPVDIIDYESYEGNDLRKLAQEDEQRYRYQKEYENEQRKLRDIEKRRHIEKALDEQMVRGSLEEIKAFKKKKKRNKNERKRAIPPSQRTTNDSND